MNNNQKFEIVGDKELILAGSFRNFSGSPDKFSNNPYPYFNIQIPEDRIAEAEAVGLSVKRWINPDDGKEIAHVKVNLGRYADIEIGKDGAWCKYDPAEIGFLDHSAIVRASLGIYLRPYDKFGKTGLSPYLSYLFAEIEESDADKARKNFVGNPLDSRVVDNDPPF